MSLCLSAQSDSPLKRCCAALDVANIIFSLRYFLLFFLFSSPANTEEYKLQCMCVANSTLCNFKTFDEAAGKPRQEWSQSVFSDAGMPSEEELALACWRKREVGGQGICCSKTNDEQDARLYFRGKISP